MTMMLAPAGLHSRDMSSLAGLVLQKEISVNSHIVFEVVCRDENIRGQRSWPRYTFRSLYG